LIISFYSLLYVNQVYVDIQYNRHISLTHLAFHNHICKLVLASLYTPYTFLFNPLFPTLGFCDNCNHNHLHKSSQHQRGILTSLFVFLQGTDLTIFSFRPCTSQFYNYDRHNRLQDSCSHRSTYRYNHS